MKIKAIHIDDETHALENLKMISSMYCPELEILASTNSSFEGMQYIHSLKPDVLFLDISMQGHTGFDLLKSYENKEFEVVFLTAYKEYIHEAIKMNAFDYLLKPIDEQELRRVVKKIK
jgi:two-component system LytT family response regulator